MLQFVPQLASGVRDSNAHVKLASERALMHALQVHTSPDALVVRAWNRAPFVDLTTALAPLFHFASSPIVWLSCL
jgi:hypothetical protein